MKHSFDLIETEHLEGRKRDEIVVLLQKAKLGIATEFDLARLEFELRWQQNMSRTTTSSAVERTRPRPVRGSKSQPSEKNHARGARRKRRKDKIDVKRVSHVSRRVLVAVEQRERERAEAAMIRAKNREVRSIAQEAAGFSKGGALQGRVNTFVSGGLPTLGKR